MNKSVCKLCFLAVWVFLVSACNNADTKTNNAKSTNIATEEQALVLAPNPRLVINAQDILDMKVAVNTPGSFQTAFLAKKSQMDQQIAQPIVVPLPIDAGGGYAHEKHKENYLLLLDVATVYQITKELKYANYVRDMLLSYAEMYPKLPLHPKRKENGRNPGKLFWQSLNEAAWLVHAIQAYDLIILTLSDEDKSTIENGILRPVASFLSAEAPETFNEVNNYSIWASAGVGMTGYVIGAPELVEQALYGLDKSGNAGFLKQLDELFSPQGYNNQGPYYQRYALMPIITFAKAIAENSPELNIFAYRDGIIEKSINTTIQLSYNQLFFPINDAIKDKGLDTIELVNGVAVAYGLTGDSGLLEIAKIQDQIILTGDGLKVANALDTHLETPYQFTSTIFGDGNDGKQGALVIMRENVNGEDTALLFKPSSQGLHHGHFDKLTWQFYDKGEEIVSDYGAARFLNVEAKSGGRYLPENKTYANQTVAHNTVVVDEISHFDGNTDVGNDNYPELHFFAASERVKISSASIDSAYNGVNLTRTMVLITLSSSNKLLVMDVFSANSDNIHQYDLPLHYKGYFIDANFALETNTNTLTALGHKNGYQHLWLKATSTPKAGIASVTWLNKNGRFYTQNMLVDGDTEVLFSQIGANDPYFNLRNENAFILRAKGKDHTFINVFEPHGEYNPAKEYTHDAVSSVKNIVRKIIGDIEIIIIELTNGEVNLLAFNQKKVIKDNIHNNFSYKGRHFEFFGRFKLFENITF